MEKTWGAGMQQEIEGGMAKSNWGKTRSSEADTGGEERKRRKKGKEGEEKKNGGICRNTGTFLHSQPVYSSNNPAPRNTYGRGIMYSQGNTLSLYILYIYRATYREQNTLV